MSDTPMYPKRPSYFANKFTRLLVKACVANELGPEATLLLIAVAHTEDARGYRGPVTFWNGQLFPLIGCRSESAFKRVRDKCVEAGWLVYRPGARGLAPSYWVLIPSGYAGWDDGPTDDSPVDYFGTTGAIGPTGDPESGRNADGMRTECGRNVDGIRSESGPLSSLSLPLSQKTPLPQAGVRADGDGAAGSGPPTPDLTGGPDPAPEPVPPWGDLVGAWVAARLPGHDAPAGIQRTANRVGHWQARLRDPTWAGRWRTAVARAGASARCRGAVGTWKLSIDAFLSNPDMLVRITEGEFDDEPGRDGHDRRGRRGGDGPGRYGHLGGHLPGAPPPGPPDDPGADGAAGRTAADLFRPPGPV